MDSADSESVPQPGQPGVLPVRHEQMLLHINQQLAALTQALAQRTPLESTPPQSPPSQPQPQASPPLEPHTLQSPAPPAPPERPFPTPERFSGDLEKCAGFLTQLSLQFWKQPRAFESDGAKIVYFVQLL